MKTIAITGRSGCGKSSVTSFFVSAGYPCIDADAISREVLLPGSPCIKQLKIEFGSDIVYKDGTLNRRLLADRAFATPAGTARLTQITHPEILHRIETKVRQAHEAGHSLCFVDGAVIVGTPFETHCDAFIVVTAPYEQSVARICQRDGIHPDMARRRLNAQTPEEVLREKADYLLVNDGTPEQLQMQCKALLEQLRKGGK